AHLKSCSECSDMMERLTSIDRDLANLPKGEPPFSLVDSILPMLEQIDTTAAAKTIPEHPRRPWYARSRLVQFGGMAAAAAVLGILIVNGLPASFGGSSSSSQEQTAASGAMADTMSVMESAPSANSAAPAPMMATSADDEKSAMESAPAP